jgi:hypothetical protein
LRLDYSNTCRPSTPIKISKYTKYIHVIGHALGTIGVLVKILQLMKNGILLGVN